MNNVFISELTIEKVRHLKDIKISLSTEQPKYLILTGKNGSGKTSVLEAMSRYLYSVATTARLQETEKFLKINLDKLKTFENRAAEDKERLKIEGSVKYYKKELEQIKNGLSIVFNISLEKFRYLFLNGQFILAYYKAERIFEATIPKHVEKVELKDSYAITETPRELFVKYLLDLKVTEALARNKGNIEKADAINKWFVKLQDLLRTIFDDASLELVFDEDSFNFTIRENNREDFDFNSLSSGFAAVLDIVLDIIVRMEKNTNRSFDFNLPGIVLIDEIETHLHLEMQKTILRLLATIFPNIQFVVSTHSPFILNSLENVVIYDLEKNLTVENGLADVPYSGIVEGYFDANMMSTSLQEKYQRYKELVKKAVLTDDDFEEITELELYLNEIPDYLALNITTEYQRLKMELESRRDI